MTIWYQSILAAVNEHDWAFNFWNFIYVPEAVRNQILNVFVREMLNHLPYAGVGWHKNDRSWFSVGCQMGRWAASNRPSEQQNPRWINVKFKSQVVEDDFTVHQYLLSTRLSFVNAVARVFHRNYVDLRKNKFYDLIIFQVFKNDQLFIHQLPVIRFTPSPTEIYWLCHRDTLLSSLEYSRSPVGNHFPLPKAFLALDM